jgi:hypothetical protein
MNFFLNLSPWHWWALAVILLGLELVAPSALFLWPAVAAGIVGIVLWFQPQIGIVAQILVFGILASAALIALRIRPWRKPQDSAGKPVLLNRRTAQYLGRKATVVDAFRNGYGEVEIDDTRWRAEATDGSDLPLGAIVKIEAVEGTLLRVAKSV